MNDVGRGRAQGLAEWAMDERNARAFWTALVLVSVSPFIWFTIVKGGLGDMPVYVNAARALRDGSGLYDRVPFEYPPYALVWFVFPPLEDMRAYQVFFNLEMLALDVAIKVMLLVAGRRWASGVRALLPFAAWSVCGWILEYVFLRRFDLAPAAMTLAAALCLFDRRYLTSGFLLALGTGTKVFPVLLVPAALVAAWRAGHARRLIAGGVIGALPLVALSFFFPWWHFAGFHAARGLQVESLAAAVLWLGRHAVGWPVAWMPLRSWTEVGGALADTILPWAKALWLIATVLSTLLAAGAFLRSDDGEADGKAEALLLPVLAFVAFNIVLSPQYHIWFMPMAALLLAGPAPAPGRLLVGATALVPFFYPNPTYASGLALAPTLALVARDVLLVVAWALLVRRTLRPRASQGGGAPEP